MTAPRRCAACLEDATHGLYWWPKGRAWQISVKSNTHGWWCKWHATVQAVLRNYEGTPG